MQEQNNKYSISLIRDMKDILFYDLSLRNLDKTARIKYMIESKEKELSVLIQRIHLLIKKILILIHFSINHDSNGELISLGLLEDYVDKLVDDLKIKKHKEYQEYLEDK